MFFLMLCCEADHYDANGDFVRGDERSDGEADTDENLCEFEDLSLGEEPNNPWVTIGGITVRLNDFLALWNGEDFKPELHASEETSIRTLLNDKTTADLSRQTNESVFGEIDAMSFPSILRIVAGRKLSYAACRELFTIHKTMKLKGMIRAFVGGDGEKFGLPMDRVQRAVASGRFQFSDIAEFVASDSRAEPTVESAAITQEAVADIEEVTGEEIVQASYPNAMNTLPIREILDQTNVSTILALLDGLDIDDMPMFLLERALNGIDPRPDDIFELTNRCNLAKHPFIDLISSARVATSLAAMVSLSGPFLAAKFGMDLSDPAFFELANFFVYKMFVACGASFVALLLYPRFWTETMKKRRKSNEVYMQMFVNAKEWADELKETPLGNLGIAALRAFIESRNAASHDDPSLEEIAELTRWSSQLVAFYNEVSGDQDAIDTFNVVARGWEDDFSDPAKLESLIEDYRAGVAGVDFGGEGELDGFELPDAVPNEEAVGAFGPDDVPEEAVVVVGAGRDSKF